MHKARLEIEHGTPEWNEWSLGITSDYITRYFPALSAAQAYLQLVRDKIFETGRLDKLDHALKVIAAMAKSGQLPYRPEITAALNQAWEHSAYLRNEAYDQLVFDVAQQKEIDLTNPEQLKVVIEGLGQQNGWVLNSTGQDREARNRAEKHRVDLIQKISLGRPAYAAFSKVHGQARNFNSSELYKMTTEQLEEAWSAVQAYRTARDSNRTRAQREEPEGIVAIAPAQSSVPVLQEGAAKDFISPSTGLEWTRAELCKLPSEKVRSLMRLDLKKFNDILSRRG